MKVTILLRVPFLDKIPNLKTLVIALANKGVEIEIISSIDEKYPNPDFADYPNIKLTLVKMRKKKIEMPTSLKLLFSVLRSIMFSKSDYYIGGDDVACKILCLIRSRISFKYINFVLEYPNIDNKKEIRNIEVADYIITHDHWHSIFLRKYCNIQENQIMYLPNASYTDTHEMRSDYLSRRLNIDSNKIIVLHSGGLGNWFCCKELACSAKKWRHNYVLVFHTSHIVETNPYYIDIKKEVENCDNIFFSTNPVPNEELDELVSSAKIGIATYSIEDLGYRAENMGLAAGKIGNYLKCGVPVIATRVHSLSYLEKYKCGVLVDNTEQIEDAIKTILNDYNAYVEGAYKCYNELWHPKKYCEKIFDILKEGYSSSNHLK